MADIRFSTPNPEEDSYSQAMEPDVADLIRYYTQPEEPQMTSVVPPDVVYDAEVGDYISREKAAARNAIRAKRANLAMDRAVYGMSPGYSSITMRDNTGPFAYMGDMPPMVRPSDAYGEPVAPKSLAQRAYDAGVGAAENAAYGALGAVTGGLIGEGAARNIKEFVSTSPYLRHKDIMSEAYANLYASKRPNMEQYLSDSPAFVDELHDPYSKSRVIMREKKYPVDLNSTKTAQDYLAIERAKGSGYEYGPSYMDDLVLGSHPDAPGITYDIELLDRLLREREGGDPYYAEEALKEHVDRVQSLIDTERQNPEVLHEELDRVVKNRKEISNMRDEIKRLESSLAQAAAYKNGMEAFYSSLPPGKEPSNAADIMTEAVNRVETLHKRLRQAVYKYNQRASVDNYSDDFYKELIAEYEMRTEGLNPELEQSKRALARAVADNRMRYSAERLGPESAEIPQLERGYRVLPIDAPASSFRPEPMSTNIRTTDGGTIYKNLQYINPAVTEEMLRLERMANDGGPIERSQAEMLEADRRLNRLEEAAYREKLYSRPKPGVDIDRSGMIRGVGAGLAGEALYAAMQESTSVPAAYVKEQVAKLQGGNYIPDLAEVPEIEKPAIYTEMLTLLNYGLPAGYFGSERHKREEEMSQNFGAPLTTEVKLARDMMKLTAKMQDQDIVKAGQPSLVDQFKDFGYTIVEAEAAAALAALL